MVDILMLVMAVIAVSCCFIFPKRYFDIYSEKYGCGISNPIAIILAVSVCWYIIEMESESKFDTL